MKLNKPDVFHQAHGALLRKPRCKRENMSSIGGSELGFDFAACHVIISPSPCFLTVLPLSSK